MKTISTLECPNLTHKRADGNTTRQVDFAIQELFKGNRVLLQDHWEGGTHIRANKHLTDKLWDRLRFENYLDRLGKDTFVHGLLNKGYSIKRENVAYIQLKL